MLVQMCVFILLLFFRNCSTVFQNGYTISPSHHWCMRTCMLSHSVVSESLATLWIVALQSPLSPGLSRGEYWSGLPFPSSRVPPNPGIASTSLASSALADGFFTTSATWEALHWCVCVCVCVWKLLSRVQLFVIPWTREATHWCINDSISPQPYWRF